MELKVYRGHIRNWENLCQELGLSKDLTREEREKQILLKGYEKWGYELPNHIYGMFALAIYDESKDELYCVRDQFGTKPFYYYVTESGKLLYGTMIRDFIDNPEFKKELNIDMLQIYMSLTYVAGKDTF
ncbi:MAG: asparagine synthetase B, partial [Lachnospiraceae bacterium]|nr:asparagine synthetase B [Lachnospiraceae bacterium]